MESDYFNIILFKTSQEGTFMDAIHCIIVNSIISMPYQYNLYDFLTDNRRMKKIPFNFSIHLYKSIYIYLPHIGNIKKNISVL